MGLPRLLSTSWEQGGKTARGPTQGEAGEQTGNRRRVWRLAWLREKASLEVRAAAPTSAAERALEIA